MEEDYSLMIGPAKGPWVTGYFQTAWLQSIARIIYN
jgi:hypothetical protein